MGIFVGTLVGIEVGILVDIEVGIEVGGASSFLIAASMAFFFLSV